MADDFAAEVRQLCSIAVSDRQWRDFLDAHVPAMDRKTGQPLTERAKKSAERKRETLTALYTSDPRVVPWTKTAHGVLQAVNTYEHHETTVRGVSRPERNMLKTVSGDVGKLDRSTWHQLSRALAA
jgi:hypothetical protein